MGYIVFIVIVGLWIWWKRTHYHDSPETKRLFKLKDRTDDQKAAIRYFWNEAPCLSKRLLSDNEYEDMICKILDSTDFKQKAMNKLGIDEDQVKEIEPVNFHGFLYEDNDIKVAKCGEDDLWRSPKYQISWLFFSDSQVYVYQYSFFLTDDQHEERTEEFFYKDITNFSTLSDTIEKQSYNKKTRKFIATNVSYNRFAIIVPGDKFYCSVEQNEYTENAIQGMKAKLREKKSA